MWGFGGVGFGAFRVPRFRAIVLGLSVLGLVFQVPGSGVTVMSATASRSAMQGKKHAEGICIIRSFLLNPKPYINPISSLESL